jgi:DNA-binding XRE family transcriptional regulator
LDFAVQEGAGGMHGGILKYESLYALYCTIAKQCKFSYYINMELGKKMGENLRRLRLKNKLSQGDLANMLNVNRAYISNIENGRMNPTLSTLEKIAKALEISSSELLK